MSDGESRNSGKSSKDRDDDGPLAGQRLAHARRANDISIAEIAKELHLDEPKVQALEENQFEILGAPVFAKGHLRKYAELVNVPIEDVLADYYKINRAAGAPPVVDPRRRHPMPMQMQTSMAPWIAVVLVLLFAAAAAYWWFSRDVVPTVDNSPGSVQPFVAEETVEEAEIQLSQPTDTADTQVMSVPSTSSDAADSNTSEAVQNDTTDLTVDEGQVRIDMVFSGDCWVEVTDRDGRRLFYGQGRQGQTISRVGSVPLRALFGDRNNVSVTANGVDVPLVAESGRGNVSRVTISAP